MAGTLVSFYKFNDNYNDNEAAANNLSAQGSGNTFDSTNKKEGSHSLSLNGSGYAAKTSGVSGINTGNADRSMGIWFRAANAAAVAGLASLGTASNSQGFLIIKLSATSIRLDLYADAVSFTVPSMSNDTWYHVHVEYTASSKSAKLYLNNSESSSGTLTFGANSNLTFGAIRAGADTDNSSLTTLNLDLFKIYNGVTDSTQRSADYNLSVNYTQTVNDTVTVSESVIKSTTKIIVEIVTTIGGESVSTLRTRSAIVSDVVTATETLIRSVVKVITDTSTISEVLAKLLSRTISESVTNTDSVSKTVTKVTTDTLTISEVLIRFKNGVSDLWTKITRPSGSWTKTAKPSGSWTKTAKPSGSWTKQGKP